MKIKKIHDIKINTEESIMTASLSSANELVMLMSSGIVIRYNIEEQKEQELFSVKSPFTYKDGGFDINAPSTIYTLDSIVVIVNNYKRHGIVHYPGKYNWLHLWRGEYHADISCFPIALFKDDSGVPHLIYGQDWNHVQIMNLDTRQILTAAKSLIEENAEEKHIEFYKNYEESNKLPWPSPYDYFFGRLEMSPNNKYFLSSGWAWGSSDAYNIYDVEKFIKNNRISDISTYGWEHCNRAACWINEDTVAIAYNPLEEDEEGATKEMPSEIHLYKINGKESEIDRKVQIQGIDIVHSQMFFNKKSSSIILLSENEGVVVLSLDGEILFHDKKSKQDAYCPDLNLFVKTHEKSITIHRIEE